MDKAVIGRLNTVPDCVPSLEAIAANGCPFGPLYGCPRRLLFLSQRELLHLSEELRVPLHSGLEFASRRRCPLLTRFLHAATIGAARTASPGALLLRPLSLLCLRRLRSRHLRRLRRLRRLRSWPLILKRSRNQLEPLRRSRARPSCSLLRSRDLLLDCRRQSLARGRGSKRKHGRCREKPRRKFPARNHPRRVHAEPGLLWLSLDCFLDSRRRSSGSGFI